jgi:nicotinate-nucleotide pyrophosphorylase (carboxylating)
LGTIIENIIESALEEDIGPGDITTSAVTPGNAGADGKFVVKENGIIAGLGIAEKVFKSIDAEIVFKTNLKDGNFSKSGSIAAKIAGRASSILMGERTALNFLQRMSGIATFTNEFVSEIKHTGAKILDTRKTVPGLRFLDKEAVKIGDGNNHRMGLFDLFLIKDNHIEIAGSVTKAVTLCREYQKLKKSDFKIEVETKNLQQVKEALKCNVDIIMLDNFNIALMKQAVILINKKCLVEASGNVTLQNVKEIAETGVDFISVGALTHSVKALDISLEIELRK